MSVPEQQVMGLEQQGPEDVAVVVAAAAPFSVSAASVFVEQKQLIC